MFRRTLAVVAAVAAVTTVLHAPASAAADAVTANYRTSATGATTDQVEPWFTITNTGTTTIPLSELTLRYYFRGETPDVGYRFACSWAVRGCANVTGTFRPLSTPTPAADRYLEVGFTSGAGSLAPGGTTGDLQLRFYRSNWGPITQTDDYSFANRTTYALASAMTVQRGGTTIWGTGPGGDGPTDPPDPPDPTGEVLFDDFAYTSSSEPRIAQRGWTVRSGGGGPGVPGATWDPSLVTFPTVGGNQVLQLESSNNGSSARQTELYHQRKFFEGTYAARVYFTDAPVRGVDGDHVVQTFFTITPLNAPMDPDYGELDFEYLPNGGWGEQANILYTTTWETYQNEPWVADNVHTEQRTSFAGWHDLVIQVASGRVKYYVDGQLFADHGDRYYPETPMSINFNLWFIAGGLVGQPGDRAYQERVDWVYFAEHEVVSPAQVTARVGGYRTSGVTHVDTVR
ncbi:cellulose binding domain-containing protein [Actinophytocola sp. KF-1]